MWIVILLCVVQGFTPHVSGQSKCNFTNIESCISPLDSYNITNDVLFPQFNRPQLQKLCNDYSTVETCLQPIKPSCNLYRRRHYEGLEQTYDYICGAGFEVYLENYYCWGNIELRIEVRECNVTYQASLRETMLNAYQYTHLEMNERICQHINDYVFCIKDTVKDKCNSSSANWQHEVNMKALSPVLAEMNCTIGRPALNAGEIAGIVIGCLVFVVLLILVIYYCTCNVDSYRKKQKVYLNQGQHQAKSKPTVRPMDPPQRPASVPRSSQTTTAASAPPIEGEEGGTARRSSLRRKKRTNSGRLNLSFADDVPSVRSSSDGGLNHQYSRDNTYQSLPSYTQALALDRSEISTDQQSLDQQDNWRKESPQKRPNDVPRLF